MHPKKVGALNSLNCNLKFIRAGLLIIVKV